MRAQRHRGTYRRATPSSSTATSGERERSVPTKSRGIRSALLLSSCLTSWQLTGLIGALAPCLAGTCSTHAGGVVIRHNHFRVAVGFQLDATRGVLGEPSLLIARLFGGTERVPYYCGDDQVVLRNPSRRAGILLISSPFGRPMRRLPRVAVSQSIARLSLFFLCFPFLHV